jgi:hypothetical protein
MGCVPVDLCDEERAAWEGAISVEQLPDGTCSAWRLPHNLARTHFAPLPGQLGLLDVAMAHSGVRLVFRSCATRIKLVANARSAHMECVYDLRCDGYLIGSVRQSAAAPISGGKPWHDIEKFLDGDPGAKLLAYMEAVEQAKAQPAPAPHEVCFDIEGSLPVQAEPRTFELWRTPAYSSLVSMAFCVCECVRVCYNLSPSFYSLLPSHHTTALGSKGVRSSNKLGAATFDVFTRAVPHSSSVCVHSLELDGVPPTVDHGPLPLIQDRRPRWLTHGSSITHCSEAHSPSRTWPATAARLADVRMISLGFGGQCHLDQAVSSAARRCRDVSRITSASSSIELLTHADQLGCANDPRPTSRCDIIEARN